MDLENRMSIRPLALIPLALALLAAGCSDERHPTGVQPPPAAAPHFLRWAGNTAPQFATGDASLPASALGYPLASLSDGGLSLDRNTATFWAVRGEPRSIQINYLSFTGDTSSPFLRLTITDPVYVPGRGDLAPGDSVEITVTIDPSTIKVSLEPTGTLFGDPSQLQISYGGADGDLNGDGVVDAADAAIEQQLLGLWYSEGEGTPWTKIPAVQSLADKSFTAALAHFSLYAVSY